MFYEACACACARGRCKPNDLLNGGTRPQFGDECCVHTLRFGGTVARAVGRHETRHDTDQASVL